MNKEIKLKPCPFCGSENVDLNDMGILYVSCNVCFADGPYAARDSDTDAVELWNTRVKD